MCKGIESFPQTLIFKSLYFNNPMLKTLDISKDFANYKDKALEISPTIVYTSTAVF